MERRGQEGQTGLKNKKCGENEEKMREERTDFNDFGGGSRRGCNKINRSKFVVLRLYNIERYIDIRLAHSKKDMRKIDAMGLNCS